MGTVIKALSLLDHFNATRVSIGLSEMTKLSGMNKATVYRMLSDLQSAGFVEQHGDQRNYRLGTEILRLAKLREAAVPFFDVGQTFLESLSEETGETAHITLLQRGQLIEMGHVYSTTHATRVVMDAADEFSFHGTSSGLAILGFSDETFVDTILSKNLIQHTAWTLTDTNDLKAKINEVKKFGYASSKGSFEDDVHSHAAPFFDSSAKVLGAIAVAAPVSRMNKKQAEKIARLVCKAAIDFTEKTGGKMPDIYPRIS